MTVSESKERACPFCSGVKIKFKTDDGIHWAECQTCFAEGPIGSKRSDDYAPRWEVRPSEDAAQSELTALKAELASEEQDHAELRDVVAALREENERLKAESFEGLYNEAIGERDALREELASTKTSLEAVTLNLSRADGAPSIANETMGQFADSLTAAEQRNAELVEVLRRAPRGVPGFYDWQDKATALLKSMDAKPTESGASE